MAGETIHLFNFYRADVADGERAAAMLWRWRHASESGVFTIGLGMGRSFRDLMLALGDHVPFILVEEAVRDFVSHHLSQPDPYLEAAVGGWSSSNTHVLRQEETVDGPQ